MIYAYDPPLEITGVTVTFKVPERTSFESNALKSPIADSIVSGSGHLSPNYIHTINR